MVTGRITEIGAVVEAAPGLLIEAPTTAAGLPPGGSVNINGTCLSATAVDRDAGRFRVDGERGGPLRSGSGRPGRLPAAHR